MKAKSFNAFLVVVMLAMAIVPVASAAPPPPIPLADDPSLSSDTDDAGSPLSDAQRANRQEALEAQAHGKDDGGNTHRTRHGKYVELEREGEDKIWTLLAQFGTAEAPAYPGGLLGPLHNQIPQPNRLKDNTTIWTSNFSKAYFEKLLFSGTRGAISMRNYYIEQSSNRYTVNGAVTDWVQLPYNAARYGRNFCGDIVCTNTWRVMQDGTNAWYANELLTKTPAQIDAYLSQFDVWDRYDADLDGNFDEPDGYIDHFQAVHAGQGEETGGGAYGTDAIWSHRWYVQLTPIGGGGPNGFGGVQVGGSSYWIGDYTIEPENGGVGVFAHEFGHDLGLPDLYDTSGNTGGAENSTGFWTLMSSGSYGSSGKPADGIGTKPTHMSAFEKIVLGWSNTTVVDFGNNTTVKLGPAEFNTIDAQQLLIVLPDKQVDFPVDPPYAGDYQYYSGSGNSINNSMTRDITLAGGAVTLMAKVKYEIEEDYDYAFLTVNGSGVLTNLSSPASSDLSGINTSGTGITGSSGGNWVDLTADLSAFAGSTVTLGFSYITDSGVAESGFFVDNIDITGQPLDGAETDLGWEFHGFLRATNVVTLSFFNAYMAEFRQFEGYDKSLETGPYNFGFLNNPNKQNWVEHFPYQEGLLVWYYDESFADNSVGDHCAAGRCGGLYLPVDAHPNLLIRPDGQVWRARIQAFDSTFGLNKTDKICLNLNSVQKCYPKLNANPLFDDRVSYWVAPNPAIGNFGWASVPLPGLGVTIKVLEVKNGNGAEWMKVRVKFE